MRWVLSGWLLCAWVQAAELLPTDKTIVETVLRMQSFDLSSSEKAQAAVHRYLDAERGTETYFALIERFKILERLPELLTLVDGSSAGVRALKLALNLDATAVKQSLADDALAPRVMKALALTRNPEHLGWVEGVAGDPSRVAEVRSVAAELVGKPEKPAPAVGTPIPKLVELMKESGQAGKGEAVFARACAVCHQPSTLNVDFGPNLAEIGDKLPREDLFRSILQPSAAISMGFEGVEFGLKNGATLVGVIGSETDVSITVLMMGGIAQTLEKKDVRVRKPLSQSLMPPGLHETMTRQELVDLVAYLESLKKKS